MSQTISYSEQCKTPGCSNPVNLHQQSVTSMVLLGRSIPAYCPECQKARRKHRSFATPYTLQSLDRTYSQSQSLLPASERVFRQEIRDHNFNPEKFGARAEDILPIFQWFENPQARCAVIRGETGSGKSTAMPYYLLNPQLFDTSDRSFPEDFFIRGGRQIWVTQPRIVAAQGISGYVGHLMGDSHGTGELVGVRTSQTKNFDRWNSVVFATDGSILNILRDSELDPISVILIDEVHERSLNIDLIMAWALKLMKVFPNLKLLVTSATIDPEEYFQYFGPHQTKIFELAGTKPVGKEIIWPKSRKDDPQELLDYTNIRSVNKELTTLTVAKTIWILGLMDQGVIDTGDILVFFPGVKEITSFLDAMTSKIASHVTLHTLHANVSESEKEVIQEVAPEGTIRIIAATNIAEASVTINGLKAVVETGLQKQSSWIIDQERTTVLPTLTARSNCEQRWGRVGRSSIGWVFPCYTEEQFQQCFPKSTQPSIERSELETARLILAQAGLGFEDLSFFGELPQEEIDRSLRKLNIVGALSETGFITMTGRSLMNSEMGASTMNLLMEASEQGVFFEMAYLLPFIRSGGYRNFFQWDSSWAALTQAMVNQTHGLILDRCEDDLEVILKIVELYLQNEDLLSDWFINTDRLQAALDETHAWIEQFSLGKKESGRALYRPIQFHRLDVLRKIIQEVNPEIVQAINDQYIYQPYLAGMEHPFAVFLKNLSPNTPTRLLFPKGSRPESKSQVTIHRRDSLGNTVEIQALKTPEGYLSPPDFSDNMYRGPVSSGLSVKGELTTMTPLAGRNPIYAMVNSFGVIWLDPWDLYAYTAPNMDDLPIRIEGKIQDRILASMWEHAPSISREAAYKAIVKQIDQRHGQEETRILMHCVGIESDLPLEVVYYVDSPQEFAEGDQVSIQIRLPAEMSEVTYQSYLEEMSSANPETVLEIYTQYRKLRKCKVFQIINTELEEKIMSLNTFESFVTPKENGSGYETRIQITEEDSYPAFLPMSLARVYGREIRGHAYLKVKEWDRKSEQAILELAPKEYIWDCIQQLVGSEQQGTIDCIDERYGTFVHITSGITGLIHKKFRAPENAQPGDRVNVFIKSVDAYAEQIDLRMVDTQLKRLKSSLPPTFAATANQKVRGGILIDIPGATNLNVHGFVPFSLFEGFIEEGDRVLVRVETWDEIDETFVFRPLSQDQTFDYLSKQNVLDGAIVKDVREGLGVFIHLMNGVQGLLHVSQIPPKLSVKNYQKGLKLSVRIHKVDAAQKRISLNLK